MFSFIQQQLSIHLMGLLLLLLCYPNPHSAQQTLFLEVMRLVPKEFASRASRRISQGQGLTLASSNRLLKTALQHDERGKWIFQLKSRIISAQGVTLFQEINKMRCYWYGAASLSDERWSYSWTTSCFEKQLHGFYAFCFEHTVFLKTSRFWKHANTFTHQLSLNEWNNG